MKKSSQYLFQILAAVVLGSLAGMVLGPKAEVLGMLGSYLIQLLKTLATPLVFFAVVDAFCKTEISGKNGLKLIGISFMNACVAGIISIGISYFSFAEDSTRFAAVSRSLAEKGPQALEPPKLDLLKILGGFFPPNVVDPWLNNNLLCIILASLLIGLAMRKLKASSQYPEEVKLWTRFFSGGFQILSTLLSWVVKAVPIAVFGVLAKMVGVNGWGVFVVLWAFVAVVAAGMLIHIGVYYSLLLFFGARVSPLEFYKKSVEALVTALGTGSSLATLPVTLRTLGEKMKISPRSARLAACVGTNLNHDGILLYEASTALFIAHIYGIHLSLAQKVLVLGTSALAAIGIAGIPEAGLITLSLVLSAVGLPLSFVPVLMTVDWFIGRLRAMTNVTSDMVVATLLDA